MRIRIGEKKDYLQLAEMKWLHMEEDDIEYNEDNLKGVDKEIFISNLYLFWKVIITIKSLLQKKKM